MRKMLLSACVLTAGLTATLLPAPSFASEGPMDLQTVMTAAERANHFLSAAQSEETVAEKQLSIAKGDFLPHLEADALDSSGFTGSSSLLGITGLTGASHAGYAAGLVASATIWDFGRTLNKVSEASHLSKAQKAETALTREDVDGQAARLYFECARFKSQLNAWSFIFSQAQLVAKEVERFVATGQRSIVDRYLSRSQLEESLTAKTSYEEDLLLARQRLQVFTRMPLERISCPFLSEIRLPNMAAAGVNPLVRRASENELAAQAGVDYAKDDFLPKLKAFAALGRIDNNASDDDYAVGVGVELPLFDGFKTVNQVESAEADQQAKEDLIEAAHDDIDQANARYDQTIESAQVRLSHLSDELKIANDGFNVAKRRYFSLQGTLIDLREALRNLMRTRSEFIDARTRYFTALTERQIFNQQLARR